MPVARKNRVVPRRVAGQQLRRVVYGGERRWLDKGRQVFYTKRGSRWCVSSNSARFRRQGMAGRCYRTLQSAVRAINKVMP